MSENLRKILIIGATSGIAEETARLFAAKGDSLFLVARNSDKLKAVAADLQVRGATKIDSFVADLNDFDQHKKIIESATKSLEGLDIVLIAHGLLPDQKACEQNYSEAEKTLKINFLSVVSLLTPIANQFEKEKKGIIAVISSVAGDRGRQSNYVYGASKGGLNTFLQGLRNRLAPSGVSVITIQPGFVDTAMTAHLKKGLLFAKSETVARGIYQAIRKKKNVVYLPCFWWGIMFIVRNIPEWLFKRLKF